MANIKDLIQSIESGDSSFDEKLAAINEMEETLVAMRAQEQSAIDDNVAMIVEAIAVMQRKVEAQLEVAKAIVPEIGPMGPKGEPGERGLDGTSGRDGRDGADGRNGVDGQDGVSVTDAKIDFDGSLVITLSTGREINVGEVVAPDLAEKIKLVTSGGGTSQQVLDTLASLQTQIDTLIPSQTGNAGKYLRTDGTNTSWATVAGGGAVDSVNGQTGVVVLDADDVGAATSAQGALADSAVQPGDLATVATSGSYNDLTNKPTIPSALTVQDEGSTLTSAATSLNFTGAGVTATNSGGAVTVAITGGGGGISSADIQEFTTAGSSTWTKPAGAKLVYVLAYGGGSGGGSGRRRAAASIAAAASGGGGGAGGGRTELWIPAVALGSTETVTIGAGGTGGAAQTVDDTNGNNGSDGSNSSFGSWAIARGATGANGGSTTTGNGGGAGGGLGEVFSGSTAYTAAGGAGNTTVGATGSRGGYRPGGGGGGAGFGSASTTPRNSQDGGKGGSLLTTSSSSTGGGGNGGAASGNGSNGSTSTTYFVGGDGAGGGGSTSTTGGNGGNGGYPGGGGGGGGAGNAVNSGAGGTGGDGYVRVVTFF